MNPQAIEKSEGCSGQSIYLSYGRKVPAADQLPIQPWQPSHLRYIPWSPQALLRPSLVPTRGRQSEHQKRCSAHRTWTFGARWLLPSPPPFFFVNPNTRFSPLSVVSQPTVFCTLLSLHFYHYPLPHSHFYSTPITPCILILMSSSLISKIEPPFWLCTSFLYL